MTLHSKKILVTGGRGFTGRHLTSHLMSLGADVCHLRANLLDREAVFLELASLKLDYVIHLAAVSFVAEGNISKIYQVNVEGSMNLLDALLEANTNPLKVILASSAAVYGNQEKTSLPESLCPSPVNHYGCSKLAMEHMSKNYCHAFPIVVTRPFNYTGVGHGEQFLIPKIVAAYKSSAKKIELGNLDVYREFNDVRDVCVVYEKLLDSSVENEVCNICSGNTISLMEIISYMNEISGLNMEVSVNPKFVRENEVKMLSGDNERLKGLIDYEFGYHIRDTLNWMYQANIG